MSARMLRPSTFQRWIARSAATRCLLLGFGMVLPLLSGCAVFPRESSSRGHTIHGETLDAKGNGRADLPTPADICTQGNLSPQIAFPAGSAELVPCARSALDEDIALMKQYSELRVEVSGHADSIEAAGEDRDLALLRARVVYDDLKSHGIDAARLLGPIGYGAQRPVAAERDPDGGFVEDGARRNRRVELNAQN